MQICQYLIYNCTLETFYLIINREGFLGLKRLILIFTVCFPTTTFVKKRQLKELVFKIINIIIYFILDQIHSF